MGISMGGLIARYAIAKSYRPGVAPRVGQYLTIDTPHRGAIIPLGLQIAASFFSAKSSDAAASWTLLESPAAQQMLCFQSKAWDASEPIDVVNPEFTKFFAELRSLGYPPGLKLMAVSNGATVDTGSSFNGPLGLHARHGGQHLHLNRSTPFKGSYYLDKTTNTPHVFVTPAMAQWILSKLTLTQVAERLSA